MAGLLSKSCDEYMEKVNRDLLGFSEKGLRTLILGFKVIDLEDYANFKTHYDEASTSVDKREEKIKKVAEMMECNVILLGCTAVEDSLQAEVPETIQDIRNAGINIWMLTGDKLETAVNIGKTCSLLNESMLIEKCPSGSFSSTFDLLKTSLSKIEAALEVQEAGLVIEGAAIDLVLNTPKVNNSPPEILEIFLKLSVICKTVICCRVTPGQKKDIVKLIKDHRKCVTLAIGDGANDVSMILEAQVGVGLYGEEGMQAVQASDYAVGEFKYLWELLFAHGRFNYIRQSEMILYFIYKNLVFTLPQYYFAFYCTYSGQTVYDDWYITTYNMILTALPLLVKGLFERDLKIPSRTQILESATDGLSRIRAKVPHVYVTGRQNLIFTRTAFIGWVVFGIFHSGIIFFIPLYAGQRSIINTQGYELDYTTFSITSFSCIIFVVNLKLAITTRLWNIYHLISILLLSIFLYLGFILVYDIMASTLFGDSILVILTNYYFYLCVFIAMSWVCVFDGAWFILKRIVVPKNSEILMEESVRDDSAENRALNSSNS
jgi:phospholipid-translocating P-type ATPase (flippase)